MRFSFTITIENRKDQNSVQRSETKGKLTKDTFSRTAYLKQVPRYKDPGPGWTHMEVTNNSGEISPSV